MAWSLRLGEDQIGVTKLRWVAVALVAFTAGAVSAWYVIGQSSDDVAPSEPPITYMVVIDSLGRALTLPATASWRVADVVYAPGGGIVTDGMLGARPLGPGDIPLRVDERPSIVIAGPVPAFRDMEVGASGRDVAALHSYLASIGYEVDAASETYTAGTADAVRAWQVELGRPESGIVSLGDLLMLRMDFLDGPMYRIAEEVRIGAPLAPGSVLLERLEPAPTLTSDFGGSPPDELGPGQSGLARFGDTSLEVVLGDFQSSEGRTFATLTAPDGGPVCDPEACIDLVPVEGSRRVNVDFTLVPATTGPVVPIAAVRTDAAGEPFVVLADGTRRPVELVVSSGGLVIVDGVDAGEILLLP